MEIGEKLQVNSREEWRAWLEAHHQDKVEIWLVFYKTTAKKQGLTLKEATEEAVCFGWVDSQLKPMDGQRYALRFSPRRKKSNWAASNIERALRMLGEGKMTPAGMAVLPEEVLRAWEEWQQYKPEP
jgi:uncharacterized protein YdeI (YjbR/CyaY-like superfamily)